MMKTGTSRFRLVQASVLFRHGDRTPTFNCMEPSVVASAREAAAWAKTLPTQEFFDSLNQVFPVRSPHKETRDERLGIFGSLTQLGVFQCFRLGRMLAGRYYRAQLLNHREPPRKSDVVAYSSNFKRTNLSAQSCLLGLFPRGEQHLSRSVEVVVPDQDQILNIWGRSTELNDRLTKRLVSNEEMRAIVQFPLALETKKVLTTTIPLYRHILRPFKWSCVVDHFHCRSARASSRFCFFGKSKDEYKRKHQRIIQQHATKEKIEVVEPPLDGVAAFTDAYKVMEMFHGCVTDRETLTGTELRRFLAYLGVVAPSPRDIDTFLKALDLDGNGTISLHEFATFVVNSEIEHNRYGDDGKLPNWHHHAYISELVLCWQFHNLLQDREILRLSTKDLLALLLTPFTETIKHGGQVSTKVGLHAGHDVTVLPLLFMLGVWKNRFSPHDVKSAVANWIGYVSTISFELYEEESDNNNRRDYYLKILTWDGIRVPEEGHEKNDQWECPPSRVWLKALDLSFIGDSDDGGNRCKYDESGECLVPWNVFVKWLDIKQGIQI